MRLDRGLASEKWLEPYPKARVTYQILPSYDHTALLPTVHPAHTRWKRRFVYDLQWGKEEQCKELVKEHYQKWFRRSIGDRIFGKLGGCDKGNIMVEERGT